MLNRQFPELQVLLEFQTDVYTRVENSVYCGNFKCPDLHYEKKPTRVTYQDYVDIVDKIQTPFKGFIQQNL